MRKLFCVGLLALAVCTGCGSSTNSGGSGKVTVSVTPNANPVSVGVTLTQQFTASVSGSSNQAVTWTLAGASCTGAACGTISSTGLYTAPATVPSPHATVTVTAASQAAPNQTRVVNVRIVDILVTVLPSSATVALNGTQQFTAQSNPTAPITWSLSGGGCVGVACGTVSNSGLYTAPGSLPSPPTVTVTAASAVDVNATAASATVTLVSSFNSRVKGTYAFHFSGFDAGGPVYSAGIFTADGSGNISAGIEDVNRSTGIQNLAFTGTYVIGSDNRGTLSLVVGSVTSTYKFSLGSSGEAIFIESDATGTRGAGVIDKADSSSFSNGAISGPFVIGLSGCDLTGKHVGAAGLFTTDGAAPTGGVSLGALDINDAGNHISSASLSGNYAVASNGRGTMAVTSALGTTYSFAFYVVASAELFIVSTDPVSATNPRVGGLVIGQGTMPFSNSTLNGNGVFNLIGLNSAPSSVVAAGILSTDGNGNLTSSSIFDENNAGTIVSQQAMAGTYSMAANGMGTISLTSGSPPASSFVLYAVTTNKGFLLDTSSSDALSGFLEPQISGNTGSFSAATIQGAFVTGTTTTSITSATNISGVLSLDGASSITGTQDQSTQSGNTSGQSVAASYTVTSNGRGTETLTSPSAASRVLYVVNGSKFITIDVDPGNTAATVIESER